MMKSKNGLMQSNLNKGKIMNKKLLKNYQEAFSERTGTKLLTKEEAQFIRAYMRLNRTNNDKKERNTEKKT